MNLPKAYAIMANDDLRLKSSSGGVFPILANSFVENNGYVSGAVFDSDWKVKHIVSDKIEDIELMKDSKYVQSSTAECFKEIKTLLDSDKKVLFTGTPCQVAGLRSFLKIEYDNLYCIDLICHGVPAQKVFDKYLEENFNKDEIKTFKFRDKQISGWFQGNCSSVTLNNKPVSNNDYILLFFKNLILKEACFSCKFAKIPRCGDLTMGDLWGKENKDKKINDGLGTSVVLVNNTKGQKLFDILKKESKKSKKVSLKKVIKGNPNLVAPTKKPLNYELFWQNYDKMTLSENKKFIFENKSDCMITNYWFAVNYGATLTCFGVQCLMEKLGLSAKVINFIPQNMEKNIKILFRKHLLIDI